MAVDTDGRLPMVNLTTADISDSAGAQMILDAIRKRWPWLKHLFADGAYDRGKLLDKAAFLDFVIEIVRRIDAEPGFKVLPRRWVVERTFGWMTRWHRLVRDYEERLDVSEAMIHDPQQCRVLDTTAQSINPNQGVGALGVSVLCTAGGASAVRHMRQFLHVSRLRAEAEG